MRIAVCTINNDPDSLGDYVGYLEWPFDGIREYICVDIQPEIPSPEINTGETCDIKTVILEIKELRNSPFQWLTKIDQETLSKLQLSDSFMPKKEQKP